MRPGARLLLAALVAASWIGTATAHDDLLARARDIHSRIIALDAHASFSEEMLTARYNFAGPPGPRREVTLAAMSDGGLTGAVFSITVQQGAADLAAEARAVAETSLRLSHAVLFFTGTWGQQMGLARSAAEVRAIHAGGKRVPLLDLENGHVLGRHAELLDAYAHVGVRFFTPVYSGRNRIGDAEPFGPGADYTRADEGLTEFGRTVIARANVRGIVLDVTHARERTALEIVKTSRAPVIASHSAMKGAHPNPQNISDAVAVAIAKQGGVVAVLGGWFALAPVAPEKTKAFEDLRQEFGLTDSAKLAAAPADRLAEYMRRRAAIDAAYPKAGVTDLVDHIDYAVKSIGIDHVGVSSDFNGGGGLKDWPDASQSINITAELLRRGYGEADIAKIWGENLLRVMERAERAATKH